MKQSLLLMLMYLISLHTYAGQLNFSCNDGDLKVYSEGIAYGVPGGSGSDKFTVRIDDQGVLNYFKQRGLPFPQARVYNQVVAQLTGTAPANYYKEYIIFRAERNLTEWNIKRQANGILVTGESIRNRNNNVNWYFENCVHYFVPNDRFAR